MSRLPGDYAPASQQARRNASTDIPATNTLERLNGKIKRRSVVVGIFPHEAAVTRLIGALLLEANDEWQLQHCYMQTEPMAGPLLALIDANIPQINTVAALPPATSATPNSPPR